MEVIVTIVSKLGYNLLPGLATYLYRGYNPFTKYHGHPSSSDLRSIIFFHRWARRDPDRKNGDLYIGILLDLSPSQKQW